MESRKGVMPRTACPFATPLPIRKTPHKTRVKRDDAMPAAGTLIEMPAERGRAATLDRAEHLHMRPRNPLAAVLDELLSRGAD